MTISISAVGEKDIREYSIELEVYSVSDVQKLQVDIQESLAIYLAHSFKNHI